MLGKISLHFCALPCCTGCCAFYALLFAPGLACSKSVSVTLRLCYVATFGVLPSQSQAVTTWMGNWAVQFLPTEALQLVG